MSEEELEAIKARAAEVWRYAGWAFNYEQTLEAMEDRQALLAEVERLRRLLEAKS